MRPTFAIVASAIGAALIGPAAEAQDSFTAEVLAEAPPEGIAPEIRESLQQEGVRILDADGKPFADLWLRSSVPATGAISEPANSILYPYLEAGVLVGAMRLGEESGDYKDQSILPGLYTMRFGLQPVNGDHLGVSTYRDYLLLSIAEEDTTLDPVSQEDLDSLSTGPSGTTHPTVYLLLPAPEGAKAPAIVRDEQEDRTGVVVTLPVAGGDSDPTAVPTQLVIVGAGPH